jgi:hypothetical protein
MLKKNETFEWWLRNSEHNIFIYEYSHIVAIVVGKWRSGGILSNILVLTVFFDILLSPLNVVCSV